MEKIIAETELTYTKAMAELEEIVQQLQNNSAGVDKLRDLVSRASELLAFCKKTLLETDEEIQKILNEMES